ncbi:hypothetical protein BU021_12265, partial [Staphylococcus simulans]
MNKKEGRIKYTAVFDDEIRRKLDGYLDEEDMYISKEKFYIDIKKIIDHVEELSVEEKEMDNNISGYLENNIIYLNSNHHENRKRFTMAHELGHFLLRHQGVNYRTSKKEIYEGLHDYINEREANSFAAELLMPELQM